MANILFKKTDVSWSVILGSIVIGICIVLTIGLVSGFAGRPAQCKPVSRTSVLPPATTSRATTGASTGTSSGGSTSAATSPIVTVTRTLPTTVTPSTPSTRTTPAPVEFLLPKFAAPNKYDLLLRLDFNPYSGAAEGSYLNYTGEVTIRTQVSEQTNFIVLHMDRSVQLTDPNIVITNTANGQAVPVASSAYIQNQLYRINLQSSIVPGEYTMLLKFRARTSREGLYFHSLNDRFRMK